jgi:MscS family membrane protein
VFFVPLWFNRHIFGLVNGGQQKCCPYRDILMSILERIPFLNTLPEDVQLVVLNLILVAMALIVIWVLRNVVTRLVLIPFRGLAGRTQNNLDDRVLDTIERPMRIFVLGAGVAIVNAAFNFTPQIDTFIASLARALILAGIVFLVYNLIDLIGFNSNTLHSVTGINIEERLLPFIRTVVKVFIVVMGALIIIQEFNYDVTGLIASFGIVGLALSLAAKDTAANVFGFTAIVSDNPFQVGDYITSGDFAGTVEHVGVRSTRVRKLDQSLVTVPNSKLTDAAVTNWSRLTKRRMDFNIGLTYATTADQMRALLQSIKDMLKAREHVDANSVQVFFISIGDSKLTVRIIAYILLKDWGEFHSETEAINLEVMTLVEKLGLAFVFPTQTPPLPVPQPLMPPVISKSQTDTSIGKSEAQFQQNATVSSVDLDGDGDEDVKN